MPLDDRDPELIRRAFAAPLEIPQEWLSWLISYIESHPPVLPVSQVFGFQTYADAADAAVVTAQAAATAAQAAADASAKVYGDFSDGEITISGTSYATDADGPDLSGLPNGQYVVLLGASAQCNGGQILYMALRSNGSGETDSRSIEVSSASNNSYMTAVFVTLSSGSNTLAAVYKVGGSSGTVRYRRLIAIKYAS